MSFKYICVLFVIFLNSVCVCQRRIVKGVRTHGQKRYMVYLVKSRDSSAIYDSWLCGGALVTTTQILTAAACIVDIDNIYAIAGYRKYVNGMDLNKDNCTKLKKQRVIKIRVPREHIAHVNEYSNSTHWMNLDIGVATVEQPYDFEDITFRIYCSYIPTAIEINYNINLDQKIGTNVVALGWGRDRGSKTLDLVDRNSDTLREVSMKIKSKEHCVKKFEGNGLTEMIENYMICTHGKGMLDGEGFVIEDLDKKPSNKCLGFRTGHNYDEDCYDDDYDPSFGFRRQIVNNTPTIVGQNKTNISARRQGICQNDHGGPLITWIGTTELLIGVAVNSLYDEQSNCIGPYLFISTSAAGQIVRCLLSNDRPTRRSCSADMTTGFDIYEDVAGGRSTDKNSLPNLYFRTPDLVTRVKENIKKDEETASSIERRITHGRVVKDGKRYMVYLLNSPYSANQPDSWLCGGVLISTTQVLTAAACLTDVSHIYVIAGYKKYVNAKHIQEDTCTRTRKRKIVKIIIPKAFSPAVWIKFDIGLGIVEKPYDFHDLSYRAVCSYIPDAITVNYNIKMERPNVTVIALGWGGERARQPGLDIDINSEYLMEAFTEITNISFCRKQFTKSIDYYFLCTYGTSNMKSELDTTITKENIFEKIINPELKEEKINAGICQNDHGGPLISLIDNKEVVIGIALNSVYNFNYQCQGPFLYLSTARSSVLLKCLLANITETRKLCESLNYEVKEYNVIWPHENPTEHNETTTKPNFKLHDIMDNVEISPRSKKTIGTTSDASKLVKEILIEKEIRDDTI